MDEENSEKVSLREVAAHELNDLLQQLVSMKKEKGVAKTQTKKRYIQKKINKSNDEALRMLVALDSLDKIDQHESDTNVEMNEDALQDSLEESKDA